MKEVVQKIISSEEKVLKSKQNEQLIQRVTVTEKEGGTYKMTSQVLKKKIRKEMLPQVIERMKWKKFGKVAGQERGFIEPGIAVVSPEEVHIMDRSKNIEQDLGDKLRENINNRKLMLLKEMKEKREREAQEKLAAYSKSSNRRQNQRQNKRRDNNSTVRVNGFNPTYSVDKLLEKLADIFNRAGPVAKITLSTKKNFAFVRFEQSIYKYKAYEMFNDYPTDGCILQVQVLEDENK